MPFADLIRAIVKFFELLDEGLAVFKPPSVASVDQKLGMNWTN